MSGEQFEREKNYRVALLIAKSMLEKDLITEEEYQEIALMIAQKFTPVFGNL